MTGHHRGSLSWDWSQLAWQALAKFNVASSEGGSSLSEEALLQGLKGLGFKSSATEGGALVAAIARLQTSAGRAEGADDDRSDMPLAHVEHALRSLQSAEATAQKEQKSGTKAAGELRLTAKSAQFVAYEEAKVDEKEREKEESVLADAIAMHGL